MTQELWLAVAKEQALVLAQRVLDFKVSRQGLGVEDAESLGRLQLGVVKVTNPVFAHQPGGFLGDSNAIALNAIVGMDAVMVASGHGVLLIVR